MCTNGYVQAPYTDPTTGLRYHDKNVYEIIKGLVRFNDPHLHLLSTDIQSVVLKSTSIAKDYLSGTFCSDYSGIHLSNGNTARGVHSIVK